MHGICFQPGSGRGRMARGLLPCDPGGARVALVRPQTLAVRLHQACALKRRRNWRKGLLLEPVWIGGRPCGEPGRVVRYRGDGARVDVLVDFHRLAADVPAGVVSPYEPDLTPSRVFLVLLEQARRAPCARHGVSRLRELQSLAANTAGEFEDHPLSEDLLAMACEFAARAERQAGAATTFPQTRLLLARYKRAYPRGRYAERLAWRLLRLQHPQAPAARSLDEVLGAIRAFERFVALHPRGRLRHRVRLALAGLYREAAGCCRREEQRWLADRYHRRARCLLRALAEHSDLEIRHRARLELSCVHAERTDGPDQPGCSGEEVPAPASALARIFSRRRLKNL